MDLRRKSRGRVIALAYFHRFSPALALPVFLISYINFGYSYITAFVVALSLLSYSAYNTVGCLKKWDHIYLSYQSSCHKKMTPECIRWYEMSFIDTYGVSIVFTAIAVAGIILGIFIG